ncbi:hypothetical protein QYE76_062522 [Lolium multiflorum]|uniref:DUF4283 domain-containing protein n=1 Tax=Lolium multiflorum TaxID=4521 RepID=A0AAD8W8H7_LOLMU|nr:hypothetical protein QYE76_062522 [Lolium multiflorum]
MAEARGGRASGVAAATDLAPGSHGPPVPGRSEKGKDVVPPAAGTGDASGSQSRERVEQMMAKLRLTAPESKAVVIDDVADLKMVDPDRAFVGMVLAPNVLHIQTISSAMRAAWGNPKGLLLNPAGDNLFIAEFGSKADRDRVMEGSPWVVGKHAVLMQKYDVEVQPQDVVFDRMAIWARILALPNRLMNLERGMVIAEPIGGVKRIEADSQGRCWGGFMRLRVEVNVAEPLRRVVTIFSSRFKTTESYVVQYEKLPIFCCSCGLIGHSTLSCVNPADRDEDGELPYSVKRLAVPEVAKKSGGSKSGTNGASTAQSGTAAHGAHVEKQLNTSDEGVQAANDEVSSPLKGGRGSRGRGRSNRGRGCGRAGADDEPLAKAKASTAGKKRKTAKDLLEPPLLEDTPVAVGPLAMVIVKKGSAQGAEEDELNSDSNKKHRTTPSRSADQAEAAAQPRQTQ